ncbi:MAG: hypothetical protein FWH55_08085 [Oscillospiraceae bacterium]|nr:hypothetical protein [Oscillospiraceae bacterium]
MTTAVLSEKQMSKALGSLGTSCRLKALSLFVAYDVPFIAEDFVAGIGTRRELACMLNTLFFTLRIAVCDHFTSSATIKKALDSSTRIAESLKFSHTYYLLQSLARIFQPEYCSAFDSELALTLDSDLALSCNRSLARLLSVGDARTLVRRFESQIIRCDELNSALASALITSVDIIIAVKEDDYREIPSEIELVCGEKWQEVKRVLARNDLLFWANWYENAFKKHFIDLQETD